MTYTFKTEHGYQTEIVAETIVGAKRKATALLAHGAGWVTLTTQDGEIYQRDFWQNGNRFGWDKWKRVF